MAKQQGKTVNASFREAVRVWARIGCLSFGGPAGQIALMHREIVDQRKWLTDKEYLSALNFCMLLPGPEAMQLATYVGWRMHGVRGGLAAGLLFVMPGAIVILMLSMLYASLGQIPEVAAILFGVKAAVLAIVVEALLRVAKRSLKSFPDWLVAALAFLSLYFFGVPFPVIIAAAAAYGFWRTGGVAEEHGGKLPTLTALANTIILWGAVWLFPLAGLALAFGPEHLFTEIGIFFSKLAVVTFGGAYAVLSYMAQAAVEDKAWLTPDQMIDGLGLAETTPGPLILVTEFVGFVAAYGKLGTIWAGTLAAMIAVWMTFAPSFLFIFVGAPYIEAIGKRPRLAGALSAITAAVVGVIFNLSLWFGLLVLFGKVERTDSSWFRPWLPEFASFDWLALALSLIAAVSLLRLHLGVLRTLAICAVLGLLSKLAFGA